MSRGWIISAVLLLVMAVTTSAQESSGGSDHDTTGTIRRSEEASEVDLNIPRHHIRLGEFRAATAVAVGNEETLYVAVGAAFAGGPVDIRLRGVTGHVRFRATLAPVIERLRRFGTLPPR